MADKKPVAIEAPKPGTQEYYQALLDELNKKGGEAEFYYLQKGRNKIRMLPEFAQVGIFYKVVMRSWQGGEPKPKYIIKALVWSDRSTRPEVKGIVLPKTVITQIAGLLAEGYDLFSPAGHAISVLKEGEGLQTNYSVIASPKPVPIPTEFTPLEMTLDELGDLRVERDAELAARPQLQQGTASANADNAPDW